MSGSTHAETEIFEGGALVKLQRMLGLIEPGEPHVLWRAVLAILIGWVPLVALTGLQSAVLQEGGLASFLADFGVHARFLIAAPLLILAEPVCVPRLTAIARHFLASGLVAAPDRARFDAAVISSRRLCGSTFAVVAAFVVAFTVIVLLIVAMPSDQLPAWHRIGNGESAGYSPAGWWHMLVSLPLLLVLILGWLWRLFLWGRFLWSMARLELRLIPVHPDHAAGLMFVGYSLRAFAPIGFALGAIVAGGLANSVQEGLAPLAFAQVVAGLTVVVVALFGAPLLAFTRPLLQAWRRGTFEYGALADRVGRQFERKWFERKEGVDERALEAPDFSATTDLYSTVSNVYQMRLVPLDLKGLILLVIATLLPFLPVVLMIMPLREVLARLTQLLL